MAELRHKIDELLADSVVWVPDRKFERLKRLIKQEMKGDPGFSLTEQELLEKIGRIPSKREVILEEIVSKAEAFIDESEKLERFRRIIESSTVVQTELKE